MQQSFRKYSHVWNKNFQYHKHAKSKSFVSVWFFLFLFFLTISIFLSSLHSCMKQKFSISQTREIEKKISNHVNFPLHFPLIFSSYRQKNTWVQNFNFPPFLRTQTKVQQHSHAALSVKQKFSISRTQSMEDWNFRLLVQHPSVGLGHIPTPSSIRIKKKLPISRKTKHARGQNLTPQNIPPFSRKTNRGLQNKP